MTQSKTTLIVEEGFIPEPKKLVSVLYGGIPFEQAVQRIIKDIQNQLSEEGV